MRFVNHQAMPVARRVAVTQRLVQLGKPRLLTGARPPLKNGHPRISGDAGFLILPGLACCRNDFSEAISACLAWPVSTFDHHAHRARADAILNRRTDRLPFAPPPAWAAFEAILRSTVDAELAAQLAAFPDIRTGIVVQKEGPMELGQADGIACRTMEMFEAFEFADSILKEACWINDVTFWKPDPGQPGQIWVAPAAGGEAAQVTDAPLGASAPAWSPDSASLVYLARVPDHGRYGTLEGVPAPQEDPRHLTGYQIQANGLGWSTDRIAQLFVVG